MLQKNALVKAKKAVESLMNYTVTFTNIVRSQKIVLQGTKGR